MLKRHVFIYLFAHGIPAVLGLIALIAYTHLLSPHEYGIYVVGSTIGGIISVSIFSWIRFAVTRYQSETEHADVRGTAIVSYGAAVAITVASLGLIGIVFHQNLDFTLAIGSVFFALTSSAFEITQEIRRAKLDPSKFFIVSVIRSVVGLVFGLGAVLFGFGGMGLFIGISISYVAGNFLYAFSTWRSPIKFLDIEHLKRFAWYGIPFAVSGLLFAFSSSIDRLIVAYLLGEAAAGRYGAAGDLARQIILIVSMSLASAIFPMAFRSLATGGRDEAYAHLAESAELFIFLVAPVALMLVLAADSFSTVAIGSQYAATVKELLPILAVARLLGAISNFYVHISFQLAEKPLLQFLNGAAVLCINLVLMLVMIPRFGLAGAAVASLLAETVGLIFGLWLTRYGFAIPWIPWRLVRVGICLGAMTGAIFTSRLVNIGEGLLRLIVILTVGGLVYCASAFILNVSGIRTVLMAMAGFRREPT